MKESKQKKTKKWSQKYKTEFGSRKEEYHAFCTICSVDNGISVEHGGRDDIRKHVVVGSRRHTDIAKARSSSSSTLFFHISPSNSRVFGSQKEPEEEYITHFVQFAVLTFQLSTEVAMIFENT